MMDSKLHKVLQILEEEFLFSRKRADFSSAFERISQRYRSGTGVFLQTDEERKAYIFTRLPATFAAVFKVFEELKERCPDIDIHSFLDVGAGPGTGMWAASEVFDSLQTCTLLEKDPRFIKIGKKLASGSSLPLISGAKWQIADIEKEVNPELHDLVLLSYSIGETKESTWSPLLSSLWRSTNKALVAIEPGTPAGYARLMKIREILKNLGGYIWAPCPHLEKCPLSQGDWCHFSVRLQRSSIHRQLKTADLGYEDEKFSYLILGKEPQRPFEARVIARPVKQTGFFELTTCRKEGIFKEKYSKKDKEEYKSKKKLEWGDSF